MKKIKLKLKKKTISALNESEMLQSRGGSYYFCTSDACVSVSGCTEASTTGCDDGGGSNNGSLYGCAPDNGGGGPIVSLCGPISFYFPHANSC